MSFWRRVSPRGAVSDFVEQWRRPNPYRWRILAVAIAATFSMLVILIPKSQRVEPRPPDVTWITTFAPDRTDAEIVASNIENQQRQDVIRAEEARREERRREAWRQLGRASGIDVDKLERQYSERYGPGE